MTALTDTLLDARRERDLDAARRRAVAALVVLDTTADRLAELATEYRPVLTEAASEEWSRLGAAYDFSGQMIHNLHSETMALLGGAMLDDLRRDLDGMTWDDVHTRGEASVVKRLHDACGLPRTALDRLLRLKWLVREARAKVRTSAPRPIEESRAAPPERGGPRASRTDFGLDALR